jgi:hydrogenase maturation protease
MNASNLKTLIIGIGNDGRGDDGLGWLFADRFVDGTEADVAHRYQLQIEDAALVSGYDRVVFADASIEDMEQGFSFDKCRPAPSLHFSTHKVDPATILWLAGKLYDRAVEGYVLGIQGYSWELHQGLSDRAAHNLEGAFAFFCTEAFPVRITQ